MEQQIWWEAPESAIHDDTVAFTDNAVGAAIAARLKAFVLSCVLLELPLLL